MVRSGVILLMLVVGIANCGFAGNKRNSSIDFVKFEAVNSDKIIHMKWLVNTEIGGHSFIIEKSIDEKEWKQITEFPSKANHTTPQSYSTSEINLPERITEHFRIVRVDAKGKKEVLDKIKVSQPCFYGMMIIPKSSGGSKEVIVSCTALEKMNVVVRVFDMNGTVLHKEKLALIPGYNRIEFDTKVINSNESLIVIMEDENGNQLSKSYTSPGKTKRKAKF